MALEVLSGWEENKFDSGLRFIGDSWLGNPEGIRDTCAGDEVGQARGRRVAAWRRSSSGDPMRRPRGTCTG